VFSILSRRQFIRLGGSSLAALALSGVSGGLFERNASAQSVADYRALVCIFLLGGNDSNNTIIPLDTRYKSYEMIRTILALPADSLLPIKAADGTMYGLHPALHELQTIYNEGSAAAVLNVGNLVQPTDRVQYLSGQVPVPDDLLAHEQQQKEWQTALPTEDADLVGWGGKIAEAIEGAKLGGGGLPTCISLAGGADIFLLRPDKLPMSVYPLVPTILTGPTGLAGEARDVALQNILKFDQGLYLVKEANAIVSQGINTASILRTVLADAPSLMTPFPSTYLGQQLEQVAQIISVRARLNATRQIFFCMMPGFDMHFTQLRLHNIALRAVSESIGAFYNAVKEIGVADNVVTFTASEFNRTFQPNTDGGSDHGWGSHHFVMGGAVKGGVYGSLPEYSLGVGADVTGRGVWVPSYATVQYGATLASWFGVSEDTLPTVFPNLPNFTTRDLGFLGAS
jgi:uncharacterized protein (DUF1501 family)